MSNARRLTTVTNAPVSMKCNFHLLADGPYDAKHVQRFIEVLKLQLQEGAFEPAPDTGSPGSAGCSE